METQEGTFDSSHSLLGGDKKANSQHNHKPHKLKPNKLHSNYNKKALRFHYNISEEFDEERNLDSELGNYHREVRKLSYCAKF